MSKLKYSIDYKRLELELQEALKADELYKLQNDAKLRAVEQKVPTYEHFRQMVNGAHLKPLDRNDMKPKVGVSWNPLITIKSDPFTTSERIKEGMFCTEDEPDTRKNINPRTYEEFIQVWKRIKDSEAKFNYLISAREHLQRIFRIEIPPEFLNDLINVCLKNIMVTKNVKSIVDILTILSECNRFRLTVGFMTQSEKSTCAQLFRELLNNDELRDANLTNVIKNLSATYEISFE